MVYYWKFLYNMGSIVHPTQQTTRVPNSSLLTWTTLKLETTKQTQGCTSYQSSILFNLLLEVTQPPWAFWQICHSVGKPFCLPFASSKTHLPRCSHRDWSEWWHRWAPAHHFASRRLVSSLQSGTPSGWWTLTEVRAAKTPCPSSCSPYLHLCCLLQTSHLLVLIQVPSQLAAIPLKFHQV